MEAIQGRENDKIDLMSRLYLSDEDKKATYDIFTQKRFSEEELTVKEIDKGIILPCKGPAGGVCTEDFEFVAGLLTEKPASEKNQPSSNTWICNSYSVPKEDIVFLDEDVVFGGVMQDHPGHQVLEGICNRMWWHLKNPDSNLKFAFVILWGDGKFVREYLDVLGIPDERILFISKPTQFRKVIVPEQAIYSRTTFTKEWIDVLDRIKKNVKADKYEKLYLTRKKVKKQDIVNEDYFIRFFKKRGFHIIHPEDYNMREKISLLRGAKEVACLGGTNALYALFSDRDVKLIILGRAGAPIYGQYIAYEAYVKNCWFVDVSLNILHKNDVWGVDLVGPTKYWTQFVSDCFNETITDTKEDTLKRHSYEYLKRCAEYYSDPYLFSYFKAFNHFQIINLMNKVLLDRQLDPSRYNLFNAEAAVSIYQNALNFCVELNLDNNGIRKFDRFMNKLSGSNIAILKQQDKAAVILKKSANANNINIIFASNKANLLELTDAELNECRMADVVITCCVLGTQTHERDGVKCIAIWDILRDDSLTADLPALPETRCIEMESELKRLSDEMVEQSKSLNMVYAACTDSATEKMLRDEINTLHTDKEQLREELGRSSAEQNMLNEHIRRINAEKDSLNNAVLKLTQEKSLLDIRLHEAKSSLDSLESAKKSSDDELTRIAKMLEDEQNANSTAMLKINELTMQNGELTESKTRLESETAALNGEINTLTVQKTDLAKIKVKLEDETIALNLKIGMLTDQNNDLVNTKAELEHRSEELNARIDILNSQKAELTNVAANLTAETETLNKKVDELNDTNSRLSAECIQAMQLYDDEKKVNLNAAKSIDKLTSEKDSMSKRISELEMMLKEEQNKTVELDNEIENMKNSRSWRYTKIFRRNTDN